MTNNSHILFILIFLVSKSPYPSIVYFIEESEHSVEPNAIVISAKLMNKRCRISKVCSRKSYSNRNKRDSLAYNNYDRLEETK